MDEENFITTKEPEKEGTTTSSGDDSGDGKTLQERFEEFRRGKVRQQLIEERRAQQTMEVRRTKELMDALREKFVQQALSYLGVPYAQRYHQPGSPTHEAPLYLDCCALVRRSVNDLEDEFGFRLGRWNQAYQVMMSNRERNHILMHIPRLSFVFLNCSSLTHSLLPPSSFLGFTFTFTV
jgi:hypothetical protein